MKMDSRLFTSFVVVLAASSATGCRDAPLAENVDSNMAPVANAGSTQNVDYEGSPVAVTLDGTASTDPDGRVTTYRWLSGTRPESGNGRIGPDPDDVASPTVTLDRGEWTFTLWVIDDEGAASEPASVMIKVGSEVTPETIACSEASLPTISEECRLCLCGIDDMCKAATMGCDAGCWDFYVCVQNNCGDLLSDMTALADCVRANCMPFFGGVGKYQMIKPCIEPPTCAGPCSASALSQGI